MSITWYGTPNFSYGNNGRLYIFVHICEGWWDGSISTLQNPARQASAHYVISGSDVAQLVSENDTAWHCGNYWYNRRSLSIELCGTTANPPSTETLDTCARLLADMSKRHLGGEKLVHGENIIYHREVYATSCPSTANVDYAVAQANKILGYGGEDYPSGWQQDGECRYWYANGDGTWPTGWAKIGGAWYFFDESGYMRAGWLSDGGKWYFLNDQHDGTFGAMVTGWREISGKWYYFTPSGAMATGWQLVNGAYYYMGEDGEMVKGWQLVDGKWYWLKEDGSMSNDEVLRIDGTFYGFDETGKMLGHSLAA